VIASFRKKIPLSPLAEVGKKVNSSSGKEGLGDFKILLSSSEKIVL